MRNGHPATPVVCVLALLLLGYTVVRGTIVAFTIDETATFIHYVTKGVLYQRTFDQMSANHHPLNVWGMWIGMKLFGSSELALRLPNLFAHALYLYASARIALKARSTWLAIGCFLLLNVHPYLLDFFGLARGYGLACGLMMMGLWQLVRYVDEGQPVRRVRLVILFAGLAALAHLAMINFLFASASAFILAWAVQARRTGIGAWKKHGWTLVLCTSLALCLILPALVGSQKSGSLYFGCDRFWSCMVRSFSEKALYHMPYTLPAPTIAGIVLGVLLLWCTILLLLAWRQKWTDRLRPFMFGALIAGCWSLAIIGQHVLLDVPLPRTRTAIFAIPMLAFLVTSGIIAWPEVRNKAIPGTATVLLCIPLLIHQGNSFNLAYTVEWKPSGEIGHMMEAIAEDHRRLSRDLPVVTICSSYESYGCMPYYQRTANMRWLTAVPRNAPDAYTPADYYIVEYDGYDQVDTANWSLVHRSEITNTTLYRDDRFGSIRPILIHRELLDMETPELSGSSGSQDVDGRRCLRFDSTTREVAPLRWVVPEDLHDSRLTFSANAEVLQENDDNFIALVISVVRDGKEITYSYHPSSEQLQVFGRWGHVGAVFRPSIPLRTGDVVQLRAWPLSPSSTMYLEDLELRILQE
ncbi:MAG TPA: hypothetical protein VGE21_09260 [Flavobacteriales bacterium]